ncbi:hypothetical protein PAXINDRAFT_14047 [Paxillus involutus ATCC 200175]|uniref:DUF6534 domain-containing protein n=1 Tax=Paxillus involutus ATCC 200175 TaxID=664439 RepID=A0A0C9SV67_PAXIN|nr:hypothetical protein PAXINDRAFT_14047 [Paxillus involutus ATCC 200175]
MSTSFALIWAPTLVGYTVALASYGATVGQLIYYVRAFPSDRRLLKILRSLTELLAFCTRGFLAAFLIVFWVTFMVQAFYAHTVWIISGQNRVITFGVIASTTAQLVLGMMVLDNTAGTPMFEILVNSKYLAWSAFASAICDVMITSSVFYYLRPARTGFIRRGNIIKRLNLVFIQMGLLSFINALALVILYFIQDGQVGEYLTAAPGIILSKTYVNSMLAV